MIKKKTKVMNQLVICKILKYQILFFKRLEEWLKKVSVNCYNFKKIDIEVFI